MALLDKSVSQEKDGTWTFQCPGVKGDGCGEPGGAGFRSTAWPTKKSARARGAQHFAEHKGEGQMQDMAEFLVDQGLVLNDDGTVSVEEL